MQQWRSCWNDSRGHPDTALAVDGCLIPIERPASNYEGFYDKKGIPGLNVQACVDARRLFRSVSIRAGSNNDQSMWNMSYIGIHLATLIPSGLIILADSGYKICRFMMTPYGTMGGRVELTQQEKNYNYWHSRSRIVVECSFGWLKNRFPILQRPLTRGTSCSQDRNAQTIICCMVLHNLFITFGDRDFIVDEVEDQESDECNDNDYLESEESRLAGLAKREAYAKFFMHS